MASDEAGPRVKEDQAVSRFSGAPMYLPVRDFAVYGARGRGSLDSVSSSVRMRIPNERAPMSNISLRHHVSNRSVSSGAHKLSRHRSSGASPAARGISIVPRRLSGLIRSDSIGLSFLRKLFAASHPPIEIEVPLGELVERVFGHTPKAIKAYCVKSEFREVELLLSRKTWKLLQLMKEINTHDEQSLDEEQGLAFVDVPVGVPLGRCGLCVPSPPLVKSEEWIDHCVFSEWLIEFLFLLWYSCCSKDASGGNVRRVCKQIVNRAKSNQDKQRTKVGTNFWNGCMKYLPWRTRLLIGDSGPKGEKNWNELHYEPFDRDLLTRTVLASSSANMHMHWFTREFDDASVEKSFQVDFASRRIRAPLWSFFVTVLLVVCYVFVRYGLIKNDYPSLTVFRMFITEPITWLIVAAIIQLVGQLVLFVDSVYFHENYFFYQYIQAQIFCCIAAIWMYEVRVVFVFLAWPTNEGSTMAFVLICTNALYYVRFIYVIWLIGFTTVFTVVIRAIIHPTAYVDSSFTLEQTIAIIGALILVIFGRYLFETHTRVDFLLSRTLFVEAERSDRLLKSILPEQVIQHLKDNDDRQDTKRNSTVSTTLCGSHRVPVGIAEAHDNVTILFADVVSFTDFSSNISPEALVLFLDELFTCFDLIAEEAGLEKIKTIGDAYLAIAGIPEPDCMHAVAAARMGLKICQLMQSGQFRNHLDEPLGVRVGIHSGSCVAGVIGRKKFIYDIWGDAVNTASRMESTGEVNTVHCSEETAQLINTQSLNMFELQPRGEIAVKGKGTMRTYFVLGEKTQCEQILEQSTEQRQTPDTQNCNTKFS